MAYNSTTDFIALWRSIAGGVEKVEIPGLDWFVSAFSRAGLLNVAVEASQPVVSQSTTAWFQPASPSYSAEGVLWLWDENTSSYATPTAALLLEIMAATEHAASRRVAISSLLDVLNPAQGSVVVKTSTGWSALSPGTAGYVLTTNGPLADPSWTNPATGGGSGVTNIAGATGAISLQAGMTVVGNKLSFLDAGTLMLFQQTASPTGWTKQTTHNDKALRVVSGTASSGGTNPFSTVFGQTVTGSHTLTLSEIPSHNHGVNDPSHGHSVNDPGHHHSTPIGTPSGFQAPLYDQLDAGGGTTGNATTGITINAALTGITIQNNGGGGGHTHPMDIRVQYVDLIIASKDV